MIATVLPPSPPPLENKQADKTPGRTQLNTLEHHKDACLYLKIEYFVTYFKHTVMSFYVTAFTKWSWWSLIKVKEKIPQKKP